MKSIEADILIVGSGITAALMAARLSETTRRAITVVEAGKPSTPFSERTRARERYRAYGESPWKQDHLDDQNAYGTTWGFSPSMCVGGLAMHWGGVSPRYSPEDFKTRSLFGIGDDWPYTYEELDPFLQEAEELAGVPRERFGRSGKATEMLEDLPGGEVELVVREGRGRRARLLGSEGRPPIVLRLHHSLERRNRTLFRRPRTRSRRHD